MSIGYFGFLATFSPTYGWMLLLRGLVGCGMGGSTQGWGRTSVCFSWPCGPVSAEVHYLLQICTRRCFREIKRKPAVLYRNCASSLCCFLFGENKQKPAVLYRNCASSLCCFLFGEIKQKLVVLYRNCASSLCCFLFGENKQKPAVLYRSYAASFLLFSVSFCWSRYTRHG